MRIRSLQADHCFDDLNKVNEEISSSVQEAQSLQTSWTLETVEGSLRWNFKEGSWSEAKNAEMCAANSAEPCKIKMRLVKQVNGEMETMHMDTFALTCRPKSCSRSGWASAVSRLGQATGPSAFFWTPKNDPITTFCATNPSFCKFRFNVCGTTARFPYNREQVTKSDSERVQQENGDPISENNITLVIAILAVVGVIAIFVLVLFRLRKSHTFRMYGL